MEFRRLGIPSVGAFGMIIPGVGLLFFRETVKVLIFHVKVCAWYERIVNHSIERTLSQRHPHSCSHSRRVRVGHLLSLPRPPVLICS